MDASGLTWCDYYRSRIGLDRIEYSTMPVGAFNDLVACYAIERGAEMKTPHCWNGKQGTEEELFPDLR